MLKSRPSLAMMAALVLAGAAAMPGPSGVTRTSARAPRPRRDVPDEKTLSARDREIAEWNAAVDRRKAEKRRGRIG